jgi:hypothetical protein
MGEKNLTGIVPEQESGKAIDAESSIELSSIEEAKAFFIVVITRLQDVNNWHKLAGNLSAKFQLVDGMGKEIERNVQKGDYLKIDIPGPGPKSGDGYDWVRIEEIENVSTGDTESFGLRVRPAKNPQDTDNKGGAYQDDQKDISHFYSPASTSSFTVTREKNKITAAIYDRNTVPNKQTESLTDKVRDALVGVTGMLSFSKIQWKALTDGLVHKER